MRLQLSIELQLDVDPKITKTPADLIRLAAAEATRVLGAYDLLARGDDYILNPHNDTQTNLGEWLGDKGLPLRVHEVETCMHGSPSVPGKGFLCGWC